jgi:hypothetical protein
MITSIKNADYSFLFQEASDELLRLNSLGLLGEDALDDAEKAYLEENGRFTSLEQYFTRLGTLVAHANNPIKYLMLPLDEPCLEVNANTRTIDIPADFKKYGVSVQGDVIAETLFLRIDRYFDAKDFLETDAYIQWKLKDGTEGASKIPYIDFESESHLGKLILVWPLTGKITAQEGAVQFSLRFLKREGNEVVYSWNSIPATITIKQALNPAVDYAEYDDAASLFERAITNSENVSDNEDKPIDAPEFSAPGFTYGFGEDIVHLDPNNSVVLGGQAWVDGQGKLTYTWKYTALDGSPVVEGVNVQGAEAAAFKKTADAAPVEHKVYYIKDDSATPYGYKELPHDRFATTTVDIFERYAVYNITEGVSPAADTPGVVTGTYDLIATHKLGFPSKTTKLSVKIPGPEVLEFVSGDDVKNAQTSEVIGKAGLSENGTLIANDGKLTLNVEVKNDDVPAAAYQSMTYLWKKNPDNANEDGMVDVEAAHIYDNDSKGHIGETADTLELANATPGWYKVYVTSMLNRDNISIESNVARVTNKAVAPTLKYDESAATAIQLSADKFPNRLVEIAIEHEPYATPIELHSDRLIYEWYDEDTLLTEDTPGISFSENKLLIDGNAIGKDNVMIIHCYVTNELNGDLSKSEDAHSGNYVVSF